MAEVTGKTSESLDALFGTTLVSGALDANGALTFTKKNGSVINAGSLGQGMVSAAINAGRLIFTKMNGQTVDAGPVGSRAIDAWPVSSVYIGLTPTNPSTLLGGGTWVAFGTGRTLVGVDPAQAEFDAVEETGGVKNVTLTVAQIPAHDHSIAHDHPASAGGSGTTGSGTFEKGGITGAVSNNNLVQAPVPSQSGSAGGGGAHTNLQPYITVYFWKRTA